VAQELMLHESEAPVKNSWRAVLQRLKKQHKLTATLNLVENVTDVLATTSNHLERGGASCSLGGDAPGQGAPALSTLLDSGELGAFLLMLQLSIRDLDAISDAIAQVPEMASVETAHVISRPIPGLLREVSGRLEEVWHKSRRSVHGFWMDITHVNGVDSVSAHPK